MRKMIVAAAVLAVTSAQAAEELKFGDLNYFFKAGQVNALANFNSAFQRNKVVSTTEETRGYVIETQLTYGVSDQLNVFLGLDYAYDLQTEISGNSDYNSDGLANPALGANYRLMNQSATSYNVDVGAVARINFQDAESGSSGVGTSEDGNFADGRSSLEVNGKIGRKWNESNEWQLAAGVEYFKDGESTALDATGDVDSDDDSSVDMYLRASYQYRPVNEIMFLVSAQATQVGEAESEDDTNTKTTVDSHMDIDMRFTTKYLVTDAFIVKFNYGMSRNSDVDFKSGTTSDEVSNRRENFWGFGVDYLF